MPTGYTAGILDGKTKDFKQFATLCSRAFLVHLRDESMDSEYKKREPSEYHVKAIKDAESELKQVELSTDNEIIIQEQNSLIESKKYHQEAKLKDSLNKIIMEEFLEKAKTYSPPTENHTGIAKFMVEQLEKTIDFDCFGTDHVDELMEIEDKINNIDVDKIRSEMKLKAFKDITYHTKAHKEDLEKCAESNKWYDDFIKSIA